MFRVVTAVARANSSIVYSASPSALTAGFGLLLAFAFIVTVWIIDATRKSWLNDDYCLLNMAQRVTFSLKVFQPATEAAAAQYDQTALRIIEAAKQRYTEVGQTHARMGEIAKIARVSRVTLYRKFESKDALSRAVVVSETAAILDELLRIRNENHTATDRTVKMLAFALRYFRNFERLQRAFITEPEYMLPRMTLEAGPVVKFASEQIAAVFEEGIAAGVNPMPLHLVRVRSEVFVRIVWSFIVVPDTEIDLTTDEAAEKFVRENMLSLVTPELDPGYPAMVERLVAQSA